MASRDQKLQRIKTGQAAASVLPPPVLRMYLDEDRDGNVDADPAKCTVWKWGESKGGEHLGAIIMVRTRGYRDGEEVAERVQLKLAWLLRGGEKPGNWEAQLTITGNPTKIRIYSSRTVDAPPLVGEGGLATYEIHEDEELASALNDHGEVKLWMEAVDYPQKVDESDAYVTLVLTFRDKAQLSPAPDAQLARLRIAPWIMASDLDPTHKVFARVDEEGDNALPRAIETWVGGDKFYPLKAAKEQSKKGFLRDIGKCGYAAGPGFAQVVIQERLDPMNPRMALRTDAAKEAPAGTTEQPPGSEDKIPLSQDNGGNLLVTPPLPKYPQGRVVYGGRPNAADFYHAQLLQSPVSMDSKWLDVGHIDEMLSFVRCKDGSYRALLMSPRLAYILLRPLAGRQITGPSAIIDWATSVNDEMIRAGTYNEARLLERLRTFPIPADAPDPEMYGSDAIQPVEFEEDPACPTADVKFVLAVTDTFVVFRVKTQDVQIAQTCLGVRYDELKEKFQEELKTRDQAKFRFAQVRVQTRRFLLNCGDQILQTIQIAQPKLDEARLKLEELGFKDKIIEIPVLLRSAGGGLVGLTADSVNMLVLAQGNSCRCLVPKPFGPTAKGQYVYEAYLKSKLDRLGVDYKIMADDAFHVMDGEIHCGTNQMPEPLSEDLRKWWKARPQPVEEPEPLPERAKLQGTLRMNLSYGRPHNITWKRGRSVDFPVYGYVDQWGDRWPADGVHSDSIQLGHVPRLGQVTAQAPKCSVSISDIKNSLKLVNLRLLPGGPPEGEVVAEIKYKAPVAKPKATPAREARVAKPSACNYKGCTCEGYDVNPFAFGKFKDKCKCGHSKSEHPGAS